MALRGSKPVETERRLKALFYGNTGVGKSYAAASFPMPYFIDTEKGSVQKPHIKRLLKSGASVYRTRDFNEIVEEVKNLISTNHEFKTLVIDPLTHVYSNLVDYAATKHGTDFGRHYIDANNKMKQLFNLILRLDMNVIVISHAKNEYGQNMAVLGQTFDCYKKIDYLFDLVLEVQMRGKKNEDRFAVVKKSRMDEFPYGESFIFSYDEIADRYGRDILEKDCVSEKLADEKQVKELERLIDLFKVPDEVYQKWLNKCNSDSFSDMPFEIIQKCIDSLKSRMEGETA